MAPIHRTKKRSKTSAAAVKDVRNENGASTRDPAVKYGKKKKGVVPKKKKHVKVPKKLRRQIKEINRAPVIKGSYRATGFGGLCVPTTNNQGVAVGLVSSVLAPGGSTLQQPFYHQYAFNPEDWIHMISVLWNSKADTAGALRTWGQAGTLGEIVANGNSGVGGQQLYGSGLQFTVKNSWERYILKNNSQRTWTVKIYECAPKSPTVEVNVSVSDGDVAHEIQPGGKDPATAWHDGLLNDQHMGVRVDNNNPNLLYATPQSTHGFNSLFKTQCVTVVMEPGQTYTYLMRGPKDLTVKVDKLFMANNTVNSQLYNVQKYSRVPMFVWYCDMEVQNSTTLSSGTTNRFASSVYAGIVQDMSIERTQYASFYMPEEVGFKLNVAALGIVKGANNYRRPAVFETVYTQSGAGSVQRVDEENPTQMETGA